ncbi:MAG: N-acetyltransferase [Pseudomonadales bacterium]
MSTSPASSQNLRIVPADGGRARDDFIRLPWRIYRDDPAWVPPLMFERRESLSPKEPFFRHADWQPWVAYRGDEPVGRISAQIDHLYLARYPDRSGYFGLLEAEDDGDVFKALFDTAEAWLRERRMQRVVGPLNLGINQEVGLLCDGYETSPYFMMGHARPYYHAQLQSHGYAGCQDMLAYLLPTEYPDDPRVARLRKRLEKRVTMRELDRSRRAEELGLLREIFNDAWSDNWGFVPWTEEEFAHLGGQLLLLLPRDFVLIAEVDGRPVGFIVLLPNLNEVIKDLDGRLLPFGWAKLLWRLKVKGVRTARVPLMGVRREMHNRMLGPGVATLLIEALKKSAARAGIVENELGWILESNAGMRGIIEQIGGRVSKRYRMYDKSLA